MEMPSSEVDNLAVREFIAKMESKEKNGKPRTTNSIANCVQLVQRVVGSVLNNKGESIYPVKWNHDLVGLQASDRDAEESAKRPLGSRRPFPTWKNWMSWNSERERLENMIAPSV